MGTPGNQSEVAAIRAAIEAEHRAMTNMREGFSVTARHDFISARVDAIGAHQLQLARLIGENASMAFVHELFSRASTDEKPSLP